MSSCSNSSASSSSCAASSAACSSVSSTSPAVMGGGAVVAATASNSHRSSLFNPNSLMNSQSPPQSLVDCLGQAIVWGIFAIGVLVMMIDAGSSRVNAPVQSTSESAQVNRP